MSNVIGFFGSDGQTGTTMIAQSVAEELRDLGKKVLYIQASGKIGDQYVLIGNIHSLDDIRANIVSGRLSWEDLSGIIEEYRGMDVIQTVRSSYTAKYFPENTLELMLGAIEKKYDFVVIDAGDNASLGLFISALNVSDERYVVTTQQEKCILRLMVLDRDILKPLSFGWKLIVNEYVQDPSLFIKKEIEMQLGHTIAGTVPYVYYGWQAEIEGRTLRYLPKFESAISEIASEIAGVEKKERAGKWKKSLA